MEQQVKIFEKIENGELVACYKFVTTFGKIYPYRTGWAVYDKDGKMLEHGWFYGWVELFERAMIRNGFKHNPERRYEFLILDRTIHLTKEEILESYEPDVFLTSFIDGETHPHVTGFVGPQFSHGSNIIRYEARDHFTFIGGEEWR